MLQTAPTDTDRSDREEEIRATLRLDGITDAELGESPRSRDSAYLSGYFEGMKRRILESTDTLQIRWLSPAYVSGGYDSGMFEPDNDPF